MSDYSKQLADKQDVKVYQHKGFWITCTPEEFDAEQERQKASEFYGYGSMSHVIFGVVGASGYSGD